MQKNAELISANHAILCLGGGVKSDGTLPQHVALRVSKGVELARLEDESALIMSSSFTLNRPPRVDHDGRIISEASAMARAARKLGFAGTLYCEQQSHDTIGSAYFLFSDFLSFLAPQRATVVTSDFHVERAKVIFRHLASLFDFGGAIAYVATPAKVDAERHEHENLACQSYIHDWGGIVTLSDFRQRFFSSHTNYNAAFSSDAITSARATSY